MDYKKTLNLPENKLMLFLGIDKAKFRKPVFPGDQLRHCHCGYPDLLLGLLSPAAAGWGNPAAARRLWQRRASLRRKRGRRCQRTARGWERCR
ncbi:MAG: hypothetical protein HGA82_01980 [Anaerolineales bacterium]|nr:hypothetical protein [Anaerolineales bacterium]